MRAEFRRHYIETEIDQRHDGGIALADAGGFHDDQIETCYLACGDYIGQRQRNFRAGFASREGAHENAFLPAPRADCVHADAVTEKRTARFASRGIDRNHGDLERVALIEANAANEFVGQRRLACAARSGDAQRRSRDCFCGLMQGVFEPWSSLAFSSAVINCASARWRGPASRSSMRPAWRERIARDRCRKPQSSTGSCRQAMRWPSSG